MTKKDYELIAKSIKSFKNNSDMTRAGIDIETINMFIGWLASDLEDNNPKFDAKKFIQATK